MAERKNSSRLILIFIIIGALLLGGGIAISKILEPSWSLTSFMNQKIQWTLCYESFQCGEFKVPVNYDQINNETFTLQVLRHKATDQRNRIGSLIVNPGGPGGSGINYAYNADSIVSAAILDKYDIVGFDQRGVGSSEPVRCLSDKAEDKFLNEDGRGESQGEVNKLIAISKDFANKCAIAVGKKLGHFSTFESAKDMEILRAVLGDEKLYYLGKSYGTYLGTLYAALYPTKVGRMVLDGSVDPNISINEQNLVQAKGFESALNDYVAAQDKFKLADITKLIEEARTSPLYTAGKRKLTQSLVVIALASSLYDNVDGWPRLSRALAKAIVEKNPKLLIAIADEYNRRNPDGTFKDNQTDISIMMTCLDWSNFNSPSKSVLESKRYKAQAPVFGPFLAFAGLPCYYWKAPPVLPTVPLRNIVTKPILIVGVTKDPATPYTWSQALVKDFTNATLLTYVGSGHTGHNRGSSCIDLKVDTYFLTGKSPTSGLSCNTSGN